jgi:hypothetical protein
VAVGHAHTRLDDDGRLNDENLVEQVREVARTLVAEVAQREEVRIAA